MISLLIYIAIVAIIAGVIAFLVRSAPFIEEPLKSWAVWAIIAVAVLIILFRIAGLADINLDGM